MELERITQTVHGHAITIKVADIDIAINKD